jgi:membrane protease YdiL (CAAX protease family)
MPHMPRRIVAIWRELQNESNLRVTVVLLTSAVCLAAWYAVGNYRFWYDFLSADSARNENLRLSAAVGSLGSTVMLLGLVPLLVVRIALREPLADYGVRLGNLRFAVISSILAAPLVIAIGYATAQMPAFQAVYPINPPARDSAAALAWHLTGQILWYAAWEFHFRGFVQCAVERSSGISTGICVQTLASTVAHFGRPASEVFASIVAGILWGTLAWRTRSLLAGIFQHWLLGASLDFFIFVARGN